MTIFANLFHKFPNNCHELFIFSIHNKYPFIIVTIHVLSQSIRARGLRVTLLYHTSVNQRLIANVVNCLLQSNLSEIWPRIMGRKRIKIDLFTDTAAILN